MVWKGAPAKGLALGRCAGLLFHWSRVLGMAPFLPTSSPARPWAVRARGWERYSLAVSTASTAVVVALSHTIYRSLTGKFYKDLVGMSFMIKGLCGCCVHAVGLARRRSVLRAINNVLRSEATASGRGARGGLAVGVQILALLSVCAWSIARSWSFYLKKTAIELMGALLFGYLPILYLFTTDMQFGNLVLLIHRQLRDLAGSTKRLVLEARQQQLAVVAASSASPGTPGAGLARATRLLRARHERIYTSVSRLSGAYSPQLLLSVTLSLEEATCGLYFVITSQVSSWKPLIAAWAVVHFSKLALLMTPCQWVESEAEVIADAVNSALQIRHISRDEREELEEFQVQLMHLKMRFSVGGVFFLDYSQLQKVISTITTFLVILLQMQGRPPKQGTPPSDAS